MGKTTSTPAQAMADWGVRAMSMARMANVMPKISSRIVSVA